MRKFSLFRIPMLRFISMLCIFPLFSYILKQLKFPSIAVYYYIVMLRNKRGLKTPVPDTQSTDL